jgi:hypothetical protein
MNRVHTHTPSMRLRPVLIRWRRAGYVLDLKGRPCMSNEATEREIEKKEKKEGQFADFA